MLNANFGYPEPIPTICSILSHPATQGMISWEQSGRCFNVMNYSVCPSEFGIDAADTGSFLSRACGMGQPGAMPLPPSCPPGYSITEVGGCDPPWYQKWQTWAFIGAGVLGLGAVAYVLRD